MEGFGLTRKTGLRWSEKDSGLASAYYGEIAVKKMATLKRWNPCEVYDNRDFDCEEDGQEEGEIAKCEDMVNHILCPRKYYSYKLVKWGIIHV